MGPRVSDTGLLTTTSLAIIALLMLLTIVGIVWGARLKRQRREADRIEQARIEAEGGPVADIDAPLTDSDATDMPAAIAPPPPTAVPAPPPIADAPVVTAPEPPEPEPLADEPVPAAAPLDSSPATEAQPAAPSPRASTDIPVTRLKGLGPKVAARLGELGITTVGQLAALDARAAEDLDARLGAFTGRMARDRWLEQARLLASGDVKGFEEKFGRL